MIVDEWGTWYDVEPGTHPGFLYQQNTLRDALVAALHFHIFHRHADRVAMANIAQMVNVLQAMILTDKEKMVRTPTYHVFEMYRPHQNATFLPVELNTPDYRVGGSSVPAVSATASRDERGRVHLSLANTQPGQAATVLCALRGMAPGRVTGRVLTASSMDARNTFDTPNAVRPQPFSGATLQAGNLQVTLPAKSVVTLELSSGS